MKEILEDIQPDLVHLHGIWMYSSAVAQSWARKTEKPLVVSPHGMLAPRALAYSTWRKRLVRMLYQDRCFRATSAFQVTAEAEATDVRAALGPVAVSTIANGVEDTSVPFPEDWSTRRRRVVALGRLHPIKGYPMLLKSWAHIEAHFPGWELSIAGPDADGHGDALRKLISELGLQRATIGTPLFGNDRDAFLADSRLFALPSENENFALTVLEALVCEVPVLASTGTPWQGLEAARCGWWTDPTVDAFAKGLADAMRTDEVGLAEMGRRGRAWALDEFGWDRLAGEFEAMYQDVLSGRPRGAAGLGY